MTGCHADAPAVPGPLTFGTCGRQRCPLQASPRHSSCTACGVTHPQCASPAVRSLVPGYQPAATRAGGPIPRDHGGLTARPGLPLAATPVILPSIRSDGGGVKGPASASRPACSSPTHITENSNEQGMLAHVRRWGFCPSAPGVAPVFPAGSHPDLSVVCIARASVPWGLSTWGAVQWQHLRTSAPEA